MGYEPDGEGAMRKEMVERVARAIAKRSAEIMVGVDSNICSPDPRALAIVAIEAMRKPTAAMVQACRASAPYDQDITAYWPIAIDEALK